MYRSDGPLVLSAVIDVIQPVVYVGQPVNFVLKATLTGPAAMPIGETFMFITLQSSELYFIGLSDCELNYKVKVSKFYIATLTVRC